MAARCYARLAGGCCLGLLAAGFVPLRAAAAGAAPQAVVDAAPAAGSSYLLPAQFAAAVLSTTETRAVTPVTPQPPKRANFELESASREARQTADWVVDSGDNHGMPFAIVDKVLAKVFVFNADGRLRGAAAALLGLAPGDDGVPGIGDRAMSGIRPEERTTPAGRFVAALDRNTRGVEILWVDYEGAISMHPVVTSKPEERRLQRLASPTTADNRISYGCINVPAKFFEDVVHPAFTGTNGIVYVLPETRPARAVFASYDVEEHARLQIAGQAVSAPGAATVH
jgi:hypothetical protein